MLDQTLIKTNLLTWMTEFVEKPNPLLGNWAPCPYARQARIANKIKIEFIQVDGLFEEVYSQLPALSDYDVLVLCFDHTQIDGVLLQTYMQILNTDLMKQNIVILEDHPDVAESVNGVGMNFGHCGLLLVQNLDKLNSAADHLQDKGYYNTWSTGNIDDVVSWRRQ